MATKTAAKIGEGDRVIRRSASVHAHYRHQGPLVGEVVEELPDGALMVRWPRAVTVRGRKTTQSAQKPGSLWLATDENVAKIQRRTWLGMAKRYAEGVERYERRADAIDARRVGAQCRRAVPRALAGSRAEA